MILTTLSSLAEMTDVMSLDQFNGLMETVHLLKSPANAAHLAKSIKLYQKGQVVQRDLVND
jgi:antitoxin YefM